MHLHKFYYIHVFPLTFQKKSCKIYFRAAGVVAVP